MTRVQLNLTTSIGARDRNNVYTVCPTAETGYHSLSAFAASLPKLEALDLCFGSCPEDGLICQSFLSHADFPQLRSLHLTRLSTDAASLAKIVARLKEVRHLRLKDSNLTEGSWPTVFQEISRLPNFEHLDLMDLGQAGHACSFPNQLKRKREGADDDVVCRERVELRRAFKAWDDVDFPFAIARTGHAGKGTYHMSAPAARDRDERRICLQSPGIHAILEIPLQLG